MADPIYSKFSTFLGGTLLAQAQQVDVSEDEGWEDIVTIELGLAGWSPGAPMVQLKIDSAIPRVGPEFDFRAAKRKGTLLDVVVFCGKDKLKTKGIIKTVQSTGGAAKASQISISMTCFPFDPA